MFFIYLCITNDKTLFMKILKITSQHRRDFSAIMKCEFCGGEEELNSGYDDNNYHYNVIPNMKCSKCNKTTISEQGTIDNVETKYPGGLQL